MEKPEHMKVRYKYFPEDIRKKYKLQNIVNSEYIYIKIQKEVYGLKQSAVLPYKQVSILLQAADYRPILGSLGMWKYLTRKTLFYLCVDDFRIKLYSSEDVHHLVDALKPQ